MKKLILILMLFPLLFACSNDVSSVDNNNSNTDHEDFDSTVSNNDIYANIDLLKQLLNSDESNAVKLDDFGNFTIDMGSASAGRFAGLLDDVELSIEYLPVRPGCEGECPEMQVIHFKCLDGNQCLKDPSILDMNFNEGDISFSNVELSNKVYKLFSEIQKEL